jgi:hypothetical protein
MSSRDVFGIIVRSTGFGLIILSVFYFLGAALWTLHVPKYADIEVESYIAAAGTLLAVGAAVFFAANFIVRLAYGAPSKTL